jgi:hypothetical protein
MCAARPLATAAAAAAPRVVTEDLGKILERAICFLYDTPYDGHYRYSEAAAQALVPRIAKLKDHFPACTHTAKGGGLYDYSTAAGQHLSAKTTKRGGKVAPQHVGQAKPAAFCERLALPPMEIPALKAYLQERPAEILPKLEDFTWSCPTIYYNKATDKVLYIVRRSPLPWAAQPPAAYTWTRPAATWTNSSTLKINGRSILEVQFHTASRTNMAVRWCFEAVLAAFPECFEIHEL